MGIPATIEFLSNLKSSFQLLAIENRIKTTTEKSKGMNFSQNIFTRTLKQAYQGISIQNPNSNLIPALSIESYFKQQPQKIIIK